MTLAIANIQAALRDLANQDVWDLAGSGAPTSGTSGTGVNLAGPGSTYTRTSNGVIYVNTNTKASPTWTVSIVLTLAAGVATFLATPSSANLLAALTDETGTGLAVFNTSPTFITPILGVAAGTSLAVTGLLKTSTPSAGLGFATGAGGTGTQASSKSTTTVAVPNPSSCGAITMNNAALNAGVVVSFTFTNSGIAATDVLVLNHISGGTVGAYHLNAQCGAGSALITVTNISAGNLSEAIVIQYALIKGVNA